MNTAASSRAGARSRTRRAILDAATAVLATNSAASLADVAAAAAVGRTTVHRYFPERSDLVRALGADVLEKVAVATERARLEEGPALLALERLCQELFELGDALSLVFDESLAAVWNWEGWEEDTDADRALTRLVERGHAQGDFDTGLDAAWISQVLWSLLYAAWERTRAGGTKHEALTLCLRTLRKAVAP
ncbi:TetR family transcriptional regulator [Streptomyces sp. URMC 129]|uniref:TetR family transcriptional regulator n=1 Tax=Streptomyces sp. URMC 129 TaxID=3423407 RepID=UPI003F19DA19